MGYLSLELQEQLNTLMLPLLVLIGLAFAAGMDPYVKKPVKRVMLLIDAIEVTIILAAGISNTLEASRKDTFVTAQTALAVYCYIMRPAIIVLFIYILWDDPRRRLFWIPAGLNAAVYLTAFSAHGPSIFRRRAGFIAGRWALLPMGSDFCFWRAS